jgi:hypothetical protein
MADNNQDLYEDPVENVPGAFADAPAGPAVPPAAAHANAPAGAGVAPVPIPADAVAPLALTIDIPDLRNGDAATITQAAPKASIAAAYKWSVITNLTHDLAVHCVEAVIRAQYAQLLSASPGNPGDPEKADAKRKAIVLGAIRAGAMSAFRIEPEDINRMETSGAGSMLTKVGNVIRISAGAGNATAAPKHAIASSMAAITPLEVRVVGMLIFLGMAVPALQGISLVLTGHHYLPTTKAVFAGMRKQAIQVGGAEVAAWVEQMGDAFDDMAFHKACHPISPPRKRTWAKDVRLAPRLTASGHGAAAIRIPALPSDAQGGKAALAVIRKATPVIEGMKHTITVTRGIELIKAVEQAEEGQEEIDAVNAVKAWLDAHAAKIGFCIGIVEHLAETGGGANETTLKAHSIRKIKSEQVAAAVRGNVYCRAYNGTMRAAAESGEFPDPAIAM